MFSDAEQRRQELEAYNQMSGPVFKISNDPRSRRLGDGSASTVSMSSATDQRPHRANEPRWPETLPLYEVEQFSEPAQRRRLSVKPGITCLWQINGRNEVRDFEAWVKLDLDYIDNWSICLIRDLIGNSIGCRQGYGANE